MARLYRLCERYDRLKERGGDRRSDEAKSMPQLSGIYQGRSASARLTASLLGCGTRKVEKIRKIRKDGTPEIQRAVRGDKIRINTAYNLIREMQKSKNSGDGDSPASSVKASKIVISENIIASLKELGGDLGAHVNKALARVS